MERMFSTYKIIIIIIMNELCGDYISWWLVNWLVNCLVDGHIRSSVLHSYRLINEYINFMLKFKLFKWMTNEMMNNCLMFNYIMSFSE